MVKFKKFTGYSKLFIYPTLSVKLPVLQAVQQNDLVFVDGTTDNIAHYLNFSLTLSKSCRFPYYVAANINEN